MAPETQIHLSFAEQPWMIGSVRIMAIRTLIHGGMGMRGIGEELVALMAVEAKPGLVLLEAKSADQPVRLVAGRTVALGERCVLYGDVIPGLLVATLALGGLVESGAARQLRAGGSAHTEPKNEPD